MTFQPIIVVFHRHEEPVRHVLAEVFTRAVLERRPSSRIIFDPASLPFKDGEYFLTDCLMRFQ